MDFPRVLVIGSSVFNKVTGGGVLIANLFRRWPKKSLAIVHCDPSPPDYSVCDTEFRLSIDEMSWAFSFSLFQQSFGGPSTVTAQASTAPAKSSLRLFLKKIMGESLPWKTRLTPRLRAFIKEFKPELIYVVPGVPYMPLALDIVDEFKKPMVSHMMDDWPSAFTRRGLFGPLLEREAQRDLKQIMETSAIRFSISDSMSAAYERKFNLSFEVVHNGADFGPGAMAPRESWAVKKEFNVTYIGSVLPYAQLSNLADICQVIDRISQKGKNIRLNIFGPNAAHHRDQLSVGKSIHVRPPVVGPDFQKTLVESDLLLLPVNFDEISVRFCKYSIPVKLPSYLASGTPLFVYGPTDVGYVQNAVDNKWGMTVTDKNLGKIEKAFLDLMASEPLRRDFGQRGRAFAMAHFDLNAIQEKFRTDLSRVVSKRVGLI